MMYKQLQNVLFLSFSNTSWSSLCHRNVYLNVKSIRSRGDSLAFRRSIREVKNERTGESRVRVFLWPHPHPSCSTCCTNYLRGFLPTSTSPCILHLYLMHLLLGIYSVSPSPSHSSLLVEKRTGGEMFELHVFFLFSFKGFRKCVSGAGVRQ